MLYKLESDDTISTLITKENGQKHIDMCLHSLQDKNRQIM